MGSTFCCVRYHIVTSTKGREPFISPELQSQLFEYTGGIVLGMKGVLLAAGGASAHVRL